MNKTNVNKQWKRKKEKKKERLTNAKKENKQINKMNVDQKWK